MSVESQVTAALAGVAGGRVYHQAAPEKAVKPFVICKSTAEPLQLLSGVVYATRTQIVFECWAADMQAAIDLAGAVTTALVVSTLNPSAIEPPADAYDPAVDEYVRPVAFEFLTAP
jgi:hypothetical protein